MPGKKIIFGIFLCLITTSVFCQTGIYTDPRDSNTYHTIVIGNKVWLRQHLRFETSLSYYPNFNHSEGNIARGNYYSNQELDSVCPKGWHVATIDEWEDYIDTLLKIKGLSKNSLATKVFPAPNNSTAVTIKGFNILEDSLLNLDPIGWVEGKKIANESSLSLWVNQNHSADNKYHIHIGALGYVKHTHDHHVIDKPKRVRKFAVRCVCELADFTGK
jgi:uncharacterized protein (TIGR02145 family)